ncbi:pantoate--beta-alanine ligase [Spiribacter vilamensis]|uniref:Pantothenate synthetase n=1 Tax=Spiribacter vilamensis TaxID=531306 RepID=A0A4V2GJ59_9GAMM|nr:pantoate--beta-alanine ligase [Spiribacter vilamensis]RZU98965.1 pantothenate synthetase [Spiribacter vilamensis]TVO62026.1 pantoate--beta-alanine ligase [Spiribacter vilamensis]
MQIVTDIAALRARIAEWRGAGERIGFVPTMGNLHGGHLRLVEEARSRSDRTVVSIFVNPAQFGPDEDYETYPRTWTADCEALSAHDTDLLFAPGVEALYPDGGGLRTTVAVPELNDILCGASRPGHFTGVATVVTKLLNLVQPDLAVFGLKDYQQLLVIQRLVRDLHLPVEIVGGAIARESDGLAMSSRNAYLGDDERRRAPALYQTLRALADRLEAGATDFEALVAEGCRQLRRAGLEPDYLEIRRAADLGIATTDDTALVIPAAAYLGRARLIDNVRVRRPADDPEGDA